jgi:hypothetical protein
MEAGFLGGEAGVPEKTARQFEYQRLGPGFHKVTPKGDLQDGEYAFLYSPPMATAVKIFDFGVKGG